MSHPHLTAALCLALAVPCAAAAQEASPADAPPANEGQDLAKQLNNPISSLISVPFQFNLDSGLGPNGGGAKATLNIQPVVPFGIAKNWNLIVRTILPVITQDSLVAGRQASGLGDTVQSFFFSPKRPTSGGLIWGVGPVFLYPTATDRLLGGQKWGAGPTFVALKQSNGWTYGVLANHIWSFTGNADRSAVSQTFIQPFLNYTWPSTVGITLNTESTYNWKTKKWLVPINLGVSRVLHLGKQPASIQIGGRYYVSSPAGGPKWGLRTTFTLLFPRKPKG